MAVVIYTIRAARFDPCLLQSQLSSPMAGRAAFLEMLQLRQIIATAQDCIRAARVKRAPGWWLQNRRRFPEIARYNNADSRIGNRYGVEKRFGIRMLRPHEQGLGISQLAKSSEIHDQYAMADLPDRRQIMRDE